MTDKMIEAVARALVRTAQMPINDVHAEELARAAISALDPEIANMREALEYGTVSMTARQVIIDFDDRERAEQMFNALGEIQ